MKAFGNALTEIIARKWEGNRSTLASLAGVSPSTIARFCSGEVDPTIEKIEIIALLLGPHDRKQLLMAAARDRIPPQFQQEIFGDEDPASQILRARLSPDLAAIIRYLEASAMNDDLTATYLRRIGQWVGIGSSTGETTLKVADAYYPDAPASRGPVTYPGVGNASLTPLQKEEEG